MPKPWSSVANSQAYQSLTENEKNAARQQYFDQVVAPSVSKDKIDIARKQFDEYSAPKVQKKNVPDSEYWHRLGENPNLKNFPNVKEEGDFLPIETTYNPDGTISSWRVDYMQPLRHRATGIGDILQQVETQSTDTTPDAINAMFALAGAPSVARTVGNVVAKAGDRAALSLARPAGNFPKAMAPEPFNPASAHVAISKEYEAAKNTANKYYNFMNDLAEGRTVRDTGLRDKVDTIISDIESSPVPHEGSPTLRSLKNMRDSISDDGTVPLPTAVELKQYLNSQFNPKRFMQAKDNPYYQVSKSVDSVLDKASADLPEFGMAKKLADKNWLNTVDMPFQNNPVLKKFWQPEDYYAQKSVAGGFADELPDATKLRQETIVKNIKNPTQLDSITRVLPDEHAMALRKAKLDELSQGSATSRVGALGKAVAGVPNIVPHPLKGTGDVLRNLGDFIAGPTLSPEKAALIKAAKSPSPKLSKDYVSQFEELQDWAGKPKMSMLGMKQLPAPKEMLALPAPETPFVVGAGELPRPMTAFERDASIALRNDPNVISAKAARGEPIPQTVIGEPSKVTTPERWDYVYQTLVDKGMEPNDVVQSIGTRPRGMPKYKKGGAVRKNLTAEFLARTK